MTKNDYFQALPFVFSVACTGCGDNAPAVGSSPTVVQADANVGAAGDGRYGGTGADGSVLDGVTAPSPPPTNASAEASADGSGAVDASSRAADAVGQRSNKLPADLLDLMNWYLTLPTGMPGNPDDVYQPALATFQVVPYFLAAPGGDGVLFMAHAGGVTTSGAVYPRSELREMTNNGLDKASWSTSEGKHTMIVTEAITHLPVVKPDMVAAQIHDADSDEVMIRLIGTSLFVEYKPTGVKMTHELTSSYVLGTFYTAKIEATGGKIRVYYQDMSVPALEFENARTGCYFKAGAYTHSNPSQGDAPNAYGEVIIKALSVTHG